MLAAKRRVVRRCAVRKRACFGMPSGKRWFASGEEKSGFATEAPS